MTALTLLLNGFGDGLSAQASTIPPVIAAWNAGMRIFSVVFIILLVGAFRWIFDRERANARIDPLTGLRNRRSFEIESRRLALTCTRDGRILLCGLIDIDDFKAINDQHGHKTGDHALITLARTLQSAVRPYDVTARLGGDEFALCLGVRDETVANKLIGKMHALLLEGFADMHYPATCSLGATTGIDPEETMTRADALMYRVKAAGKGKWLFNPTA